MNRGTSRFRKMAVGAVASATILGSLIPLANQARATSSFAFARYAGADRYETAKLIAEGTFGTANDVVLASGENFPDALAGNYLAGFKTAPILLTTRDALPAFTSQALSDLKAKNVWILGGTQAVSAAVASAVTSAGYTVTRIGGTDRYDTAKMVAETPPATNVGLIGAKKTALLASGANFPDAISGGPAAYALALPTLLTDPSALSASAKTAMTDLGITNVIILGGTQAVSQAVEDSVKANGATTTRVAGTDRYDTAALFAAWELANGFTNPPTHVNVATGLKFPDALAGGPHGGKTKAVTLLNASVPPQEAKFLTDNKATLANGHIFGGDNAVSAADQATMETDAGKISGGNATVTTLPELMSASILKVVDTGHQTSTNPAGTWIQYVFDEAISSSAPGPDGTKFHVYDSTAPNTINSGTNAVCGGLPSCTFVDPTNPNAVDAIFTALTAADAATAAAKSANMSVATVAQLAVTDLQAQTNPEGAAGIGTAHSIAGGGAGVTAAPDVMSVTPTGASCGALCTVAQPADSTAVNFVFDKAAFVKAGASTVALAAVAPVAGGLAGPNFVLVLTSGKEEVCGSSTDTSVAGGGSGPGGSGTTTVTVVCKNDASTDGFPLTAAQIARGVVQPGTVTPTSAAAIAAPSANPPNVLQASTSPHTAATNASLGSVTFSKGVTTGCNVATPAPCDIAFYNFDQPIVSGALDLTKFFVYNASAVAINPAAVSASTSSASQVAGFFAGGTLSNDVGGSVLEAAITNSTTGANALDSVGVSNASTTAVAPGLTSGPDLSAVTLAAVQDAFGTIKGYSGTFTFDQPLGTATAAPVNAGTAAKLLLWDSDGTKLTCPVAGLAAWSVTTASSVMCDFTTSGKTLNQQQGGVLGTVTQGAVADNNGLMTPEGAKTTTGGNGTPQQG